MIKCALCKYNMENQYCQYNEREDKFLENCDTFEFEPYHLIEYLKGLEKKLELMDARFQIIDQHADRIKAIEAKDRETRD